MKMYNVFYMFQDTQEQWKKQIMLTASNQVQSSLGGQEHVFFFRVLADSRGIN